MISLWDDFVEDAPAMTIYVLLTFGEQLRLNTLLFSDNIIVCTHEILLLTNR